MNHLFTVSNMLALLFAVDCNPCLSSDVIISTVDTATSSSPVQEDQGHEAAAVWTKSAQELVEKSKEEEYDEYFKDMLL